MLQIVVGNKKYSSWSLRGWLGLKLTGAPFQEVVVALDMPDTAENIRRYSPAGRVPVLIDGELRVWDSLAICEYLHEKFPERELWPEDRVARAEARSISAEMHAGFSDLRNECAMRIVEERPYKPLREQTQRDVERIGEIWSAALQKSGGPYLFGRKPCIADAFYAPVVSRFRTYSIPVAGALRQYCDAIWSWPALQEWVAAAKAEKLRAKFHED